MISFDKAEEIVRKYTIDTGIEELMFMDSLGRVLAGDIISDMDTTHLELSN